MDETDPEADAIPALADVLPDLDVAGQLLAAIAREDHDGVEALRESADADWWNVAWTLALLVQGVRTGEPAAVALVDSLMGDEPAS